MQTVLDLSSKADGNPRRHLCIWKFPSGSVVSIAARLSEVTCRQFGGPPMLRLPPLWTNYARHVCREKSRKMRRRGWDGSRNWTLCAVDGGFDSPWASRTGLLDAGLFIGVL